MALCGVVSDGASTGQLILSTLACQQREVHSRRGVGDKEPWLAIQPSTSAAMMTTTITSQTTGGITADMRYTPVFLLHGP
jgi:hypothetical protein